MFAKTKSGAIIYPTERSNPFFPQLALRRRSNEHPMVMFAALSAICLGSTALYPNAGPSLTSPERAPVKVAEIQQNTGKGPRLASLSDSEIACYGQAWGNQDKACIAAIDREDGNARQVRMIASAEPDMIRPNVF